MIPKHPFSALVRLLPALLWLGACGVFVWLFLRLFGGVRSNPAGTWLDTLFVYAFLALAAFALRMAYKEFLSELPALRADQPLLLARPRRLHNPSAPVRYPLPQPLQERLQEILGVLETAGILQPGEVSLGEIIGLAEVNDEYESIDIVDVAGLLQGLASQRSRPFVNLALAADQFEVYEFDIVMLVHEFARLSDHLQQLGAVRLRGIGGGPVEPAARGTFPADNAVVEFEFGGQHHSVPFVMYMKNLPGHLMERLALLFTRPGDERRYVVAGFDQKVIISYLAPENVPALNRALSEDSPWFGVLE